METISCDPGHLDVCSGNGNCLSIGVCSCNRGYSFLFGCAERPGDSMFYVHVSSHVILSFVFWTLFLASAWRLIALRKSGSRLQSLTLTMVLVSSLSTAIYLIDPLGDYDIIGAQMSLILVSNGMIVALLGAGVMARMYMAIYAKVDHRTRSLLRVLDFLTVSLSLSIIITTVVAFFRPRALDIVAMLAGSYLALLVVLISFGAVRVLKFTRSQAQSEEFRATAGTLILITRGSQGLGVGVICATVAKMFVAPSDVPTQWIFEVIYRVLTALGLTAILYTMGRGVHRHGTNDTVATHGRGANMVTVIVTGRGHGYVVQGSRIQSRIPSEVKPAVSAKPTSRESSVAALPGSVHIPTSTAQDNDGPASGTVSGRVSLHLAPPSARTSMSS